MLSGTASGTGPNYECSIWVYTNSILKHTVIDDIYAQVTKMHVACRVLPVAFCLPLVALCIRQITIFKGQLGHEMLIVTTRL